MQKHPTFEMLELNSNDRPWFWLACPAMACNLEHQSKIVKDYTTCNLQSRAYYSCPESSDDN